MAESFRERRAAQRQEVFDRVINLVDDLSRIDKEREMVDRAIDGLLVSYVVERLSKRDKDSVKIFKNMLPSKLHRKIDETIEMFEFIHGSTPDL
jgi:hypothetical protein